MSSARRSVGKCHAAAAAVSGPLEKASLSEEFTRSGSNPSISGLTARDGFEPDRVVAPLSEAFSDGPDAAAAAAWHFPTERRAELITQLATSAAAHPDAHQAKYTLACLDAIGGDPQSTRLYLTAAAKLAGYWASIATPNGH